MAGNNEENKGLTICSVLVIVYIILSLVAAFVIWWNWPTCTPGETFCNCSGLQANDYCNDPQELKRLYDNGEITEQTIPPNGTPSMNSIAPYDLFVKDPNNYNALYVQKYDSL